jgi:hypothetical protein
MIACRRGKQILHRKLHPHSAAGLCQCETFKVDGASDAKRMP